MVYKFNIRQVEQDVCIFSSDDNDAGDVPFSLHSSTTSVTHGHVRGSKWTRWRVVATLLVVEVKCLLFWRFSLSLNKL